MNFQYNRLDRIPYTQDVKRNKVTGELKMKLTRIAYPRMIRIGDFN